MLSVPVRGSGTKHLIILFWFYNSLNLSSGKQNASLTLYVKLPMETLANIRRLTLMKRVATLTTSLRFTANDLTMFELFLLKPITDSIMRIFISFVKEFHRTSFMQVGLLFYSCSTNSNCSAFSDSRKEILASRKTSFSLILSRFFPKSLYIFPCSKSEYKDNHIIWRVLTRLSHILPTIQPALLTKNSMCSRYRGTKVLVAWVFFCSLKHQNLTFLTPDSSLQNVKDRLFLRI